MGAEIILHLASSNDTLARRSRVRNIASYSDRVVPSLSIYLNLIRLRLRGVSIGAILTLSTTLHRMRFCN
jgi:hypothetical protein